MADLRTVLAAILGVGLGLVLLVFPGFVVRVQTAGRLPHDRGGDYGEGGVDQKWAWLVRAVGVVVLVGGLYFGIKAFGVL